MNIARRYVLVQFILFAVFVASTILVPSAPTSPIKLVGAIFMLVGVGVFVAALIAHNQTNQRPPKVSPTPSSKSRLVDRGIYGFVRHPIYTGVLAFTLGIALWHGGLPVLAIWVVLLGFFWMKSLYEEKLLKQQYSDYRVYMKKTGRFIPGV
jgi:protein-S-isoprenylcysteine O-methyltransferase Ste14